MKNELMPIQGRATSNCLFFALSTLLHSYDRNIHYHHGCLWNFKLAGPDAALLSERIFEDDLYQEHYPYIKTVSGISLHKNGDFDIARIKKDLYLGKPVLVHYDSYWCSWNRNYQKHHYDHFFILKNHNSDEDSYECIDSFYLDAPVSISGRQLKEGIIDILDYDILEEPSFPQVYPVILQSLKRHIPAGAGSLMFTDMLRMAKEIQEINFLKEFDGYTDVKTIPLFIKIQNISFDKTALSSLCRDIGSEGGQAVFQELSSGFHHLYREWNLLLVMLMKYFITKEDRLLSNSSSQMNRIVSSERDLAEMMNRVT